MTIASSTKTTLESLNAYLAAVAEHRDKEAFAKLFDHYAPLIRSYSLARDPGATLLADDLVQEVMTRIWLKAGSYNVRLANLNTWVFTLARNCRIDYLRKNGRFATDIDPDEIFNEMEDESPGPFQQAHQLRVENNLHNSLQHLPREQTEIIRKVYLEGKSHQQASEELKLPLGTVKSRVRLALKKLEVLVRGEND